MDGFIGDGSARAPDLLGTVVGLRTFDRAGHYLASPYQGTEWRKPELRATCNPERSATARALTKGLGQKPKLAASVAAVLVERQRHLPEHRAPDLDCSCGLYAYHEADDPHLESAPLIAIVEAWGDLVVHARGFRSEHLRIVALALGEPLPGVQGERLIEAARRANAWWKVPLLRTDDLAVSMSEFGSPVPEELRPQEEE
jgi:hypothetical protein